MHTAHEGKDKRPVRIFGGLVAVASNTKTCGRKSQAFRLLLAGSTSAYGSVISISFPLLSLLAVRITGSSVALPNFATPLRVDFGR